MNVIIIIILTSTVFSCSSTVTDSERLSNLSYMEFADRADCSNQIGTTLEERICLNLKFRRVDSIMNVKLDSLFETLPSEKANTLESEQEIWLVERRKKSEETSDGFRGHVFGIIYLQSMIEITEKRIDFIESIKY